MPLQDFFSGRGPRGNHMDMIETDLQKYHGEKSPVEGSPYRFQYASLLSKNDNRIREDLGEFLFPNRGMANLIVRFARLFVIGESNAHSVMT